MSETPFTIKLANRMNLLPDYMFVKLNALRQQKRREGMDLIDMSMGNPKDPTPSPIVDKLVEVVRDPRNHRYSVAAGLYNLRNELAKYYKAQFDVTLEPEKEIIFTIGSKEGFSHLCLALIGEGDTAIIPAPTYPIHTYAVLLAGGNTIRVPVENDELFLQGVDNACRTLVPKPKILFMNYPHNPSAKVAEIPFFEEVVKLARKHNLIVVHDFAYSRITYDGFEQPSFLQARGAREVGVEFGTMSKAYNMAGWRIGYAIGNQEIIKALNRIKGYYDYGIFQAIQIASIIAIRDCQDYVKAQQQIYQERRDAVVHGLRNAGWDIDPPMGGMFAWVRIPEEFRAEGSYNFAMRLIEEANVVVSPGVGFGDEGEGYLRFAFVENTLRLKQAMRNIKTHFSVKSAVKKAQ